MLAVFLPLVSLLRNGVHQSGDFAINIEKTIDLWNSLSYGIFPVSWASLLNATYGYPLFIFTYPLPYYAISFFHLFGLSFIASEKIVIAMAFLLSGFFMYLLSRQYTSSRGASLATALYLFAPYHLVDMHYRVAIGELFAFAFVPFCFYSLKKNWAMLSIAVFLLLLSHQALSLVSLPLLFAFHFFTVRNLKQSLYCAGSILLGLLLASFFVFPVLFETQYTHQQTFSNFVSFIKLRDILFSPWYYGFLFQGPKGELSFALGYHNFLVIILGFYLYIRGFSKKGEVQLICFLLTIICLLIFMLTAYSAFIWNAVPILKNFQFTYRLLMPLAFFISFLGGIIFNKVSQKIFYLLFFSIIGVTILNWGTRSMISDITDLYLIQHAPLSTFEAEGLQPASPRWTDIDNLWMKTPPTEHIEIIKGNGMIQQTKRTPILHEYISMSQSDITVRENTLFFPGWKIYIDGNEEILKPNKIGLIEFKVKKGPHEIQLVFTQTPIRTISKLLSIISALVLAIFILRKK